MNKRTDPKAYIITGPTSGIGRRAALELAKHGTTILVGRNRNKLNDVQTMIERRGQRAVAVLCDLSDIASVRRAAVEILALKLPIAGVLNNAGIMQMRGGSKNSQGWDMTFATNFLGPFALTEALAPHLLDRTNVVFVASAVEDPERKPAVAFGFRGGRYISAEESAQGNWKAGGSVKPGMDAYATSKQALLAAMLAFGRQIPRLRFNAVEPGFNPTTGLGGDPGPSVRLLQKYILPPLVLLLMPFIKILSTPTRAARVITKVLVDDSGKSGIYYDEHGHPMQGSTLVRDVKFQDRVVDETRALLSKLG